MAERSSVADAVSTARKVEFLAEPGKLPDSSAGVEVRETHYAWLFLTQQFVYKFKKPIRGPRLDYRSLTVRRAMCDRELRLNRRLASATYLEVRPLLMTHSGALSMTGSGEPVEWLVTMRRLPAELMMDVALSEGRVSQRDLGRLVAKLVAFYSCADRAPLASRQYQDKLADETSNALKVLAQRLPASERRRAASIGGMLQARLIKCEQLLEDRVEGHFIRDCHGDLRPEHICLHEELQIIDSLEFDHQLRYLDSLEELCFLASECRRSGHAWVEGAILDAYRAVSGDQYPDALVDLYAARRALTRAMLMAWRGAERADFVKSLDRAVEYLEMTRDYLSRGGSHRP